MALALGCLAAAPPLWLRRIRSYVFDPSRRISRTPAGVGLRYEAVAFESEDRVRLAGFFIPATTDGAHGHVLYFHGAGGNMGDRVALAKLFAARGLDVFLFDYRGYGESEGRPDEEGTYRDARAARAALCSRRGVDPSRIAYVGESLGGAVALALALEDPPRALVLQSTFPSIRDLVRHHFPHVPPSLVPDMYPSRARIGALRVPVLCVHGQDDTVIPPAMGRLLFDAASEPKTFVLIPKVGHAGLVPNAGIHYSEIVADWLLPLLS